MARNFVQFQHRGERDEQQDSAAVFVDHSSGALLAFVADGAGGHSGGRLASQAVLQCFENSFYAADHPVVDPETFLRETTRTCHEKVREVGDLHGIQPRSTLAAVYLDREKVHCIHSGDSRIYLFQGEEIHRRTLDHSVAQLLFARGAISEDEIGSHPDQGRLTQCIGGEEYVEPDYFSEPVEPGASVLLCSDGIWEHFTSAEMGKIQSYLARGGEAAGAKIAEACIDRGKGKADNLTVISILPEEESSTFRARRDWITMGVLLILAWLSGFLLVKFGHI